MKKNIAAGICFVLTLIVLASCSPKNTGKTGSSPSAVSSGATSAASTASDSSQGSSSAASMNSASSAFENSSAGSQSSGVKSGTKTSGGFTAVTYPDVVKTISANGHTTSSYIEMAAGRAASYESNAGFKNGLLSVVVSPYYTMTIGGSTVPVYATLSYADGGGMLHSYAMIDVKSSNFSLDVKIQSDTLGITNAMVLPSYLNVKPSVKESIIAATIKKTGTYTFMVNDLRDEVSQMYPLTLFVRNYVDEDAEISAYKKQYGEKNVTVYNAGVHYFDKLQMTSSNSVIYLRRGSLLVAKHGLDIQSDSDNASKSEAGASSSNGWGLNRYPVLSAHQKSNVKLVGRGTIDCAALDWHERRGIMFTSCNNVEISGILLTNFPEWTVITYNCTNVNIRDTAIFGWKTNSDGFAVCNTQNAKISNCYAHSGDDLFEVKTLGGAQTTEDVTFTDCVAWNGKARCFGLTSETEKDISNVLFKHCAVIWRDATWDNGILGSLVVIVSGSGKVSNMTFDDIEIYQEEGRAINVAMTTSNATSVSGITFKNITYKSAQLNLINTRVASAGSAGVTFSNITANGTKLTESNKKQYISTSGKNISYSIK